MPIPAAILDLRAWKLTTPLGSKGNPTELSPSQLAVFQGNQWCHVTDDGGVSFGAPVNGVTTSGSKYPRCEPRELNADGSLASWSPTDGKVHILDTVMAWTHLPNDKPQVVSDQIHDAKNDITVWRLEGSNLWITQGNNDHYKLVTSSYKLGDKVWKRYIVQNGVIHVLCNGVEVAQMKASGSGWYFKGGGAYVQANTTNSSPPDASNFGAVTTYYLKATHGSIPPAPVLDPPGPAPTPTPDPTPVPSGNGPDTILIVRHGEKPATSGAPYGVTADGSKDSHSLTTTGWARAGAFVALFTSSGRFPKVTSIVASQGSTASRRPAQTVSLLAAARKLTVNTAYDFETQLAQAVAAIQGMTGCVLVSAEHQMIPALTAALGASPPVSVWSDSRFDVVWRLDRSATGYRVTQVCQQVLSGDLATAL